MLITVHPNLYHCLIQITIIIITQSHHHHNHIFHNHYMQHDLNLYTACITAHPLMLQKIIITRQISCQIGLFCP